jgi:hypothetical protein
MQKHTERYEVKLTKEQRSSLEILKYHDVNVSQFIRDAIREKIKREWPKIKESKNKNKCPF